MIGSTAEQRHRMIAQIAYLKAERRGFHGGNPEQDWYEAEAEFEAMHGRQKKVPPA